MYLGFALREWAFVQSTPIRFGDIYRGWKFGFRATEEGYLDLYDRVIVETFKQGQYNELDYAPLRLLAMTTWAKVTRAQFPDATDRWQREYAFTRPVLLFNAATELFGAVGLFLLVRLWALRQRPPPGVWRVWRADLLGLLAAALLWFSPAMILSAHCWPTWDAWVPVFFIWAVLMASCRQFFWCGVVVGIGAMFKGQQWIVAPLFILYPLLQRRWLEPVRFAIGAAVAIAAVTSVWAVRIPATPENVQASLDHAQRNWREMPFIVTDVTRYRPPGEPTISRYAVGWIALATATAALPLVLRKRPRLALAIQAALLPAAAACVLLAAGPAPPAWLALAGLLTLAALAHLNAARFLAPAAAFAGASFACYPLLGSPSGWFDIGWKFGSNHWVWLIVGHTSNLPGILHRSYRWNNETDLLYVVASPFGHDLTLRQLLKAVYAVGLGLSAFAAARLEKAGDPRFLLAVVAPWAIMFAFLGQMHERYLLFAAAASSAFLLLGPGWLLLSLFWTAATFLMTLHVMLLYPDAPHLFGTEGFMLTQATAARWLKWIAPTHPDLGWATCLSALVVLFGALARPRPALPPLATPPPAS